MNFFFFFFVYIFFFIFFRQYGAFTVSYLLLPWCVSRALAGVFSFSPLIFSKQKQALKIELIYVVSTFLTIVFCISIGSGFFDVVRYLSYVGTIAVLGQLAWYFHLFRKSKSDS